MILTRREALVGGVAGATLAASPALGTVPFPSQRPDASARRFTSRAVEREIARVSAKIGDAKLRWMFANCYPNTLDTTVRLRTIDGAPDAFVITGDIPCLWLRDSSAQMTPYLHLAREDAPLRTVFRGLIARQARSILIDPYANAFMEDPSAKTTLSWALTDKTEMKPGVAERKWEIDSLCYPMRLAHGYWQATRDPTPFDARWAAAARLSIATFRAQQRKDGPGPYRFLRVSDRNIETMPLEGLGNPSRSVGLIHCGFRPSDDACLYPFLIPANLFAVTVLRELAVVAQGARGDAALAQEATALADEVARALAEHGRMRLRDGSDVWAYEVDGFGNAIFMDDANVPSLSGLGYLGCVAPNDPLWLRTQAAAWSPANPYFFKGKAGEGIGGPHVGLRQIWPMSLIVRALSSDDPATIRACLKTLRDTDAGTGFMHETFDQDDPAQFTRSWFAWANGLFGELIVRIAHTRPALLEAPL
ncbi:glycoside hydrolase family 125 protein [Sphingomonas sp. TREG-RG-20F-R18-01]|uniref:glycoside hydrolase family 125 protein n=1 Tax=Sphingomonas sp. TREG-RG-20F-R18-01 TaxID=2914982 RepID=UPI001F59E9A2|nr:glycoside hydrolase family 125 protein [Sphingomonas sp. TREG-RG-20F-R18-01]